MKLHPKVEAVLDTWCGRFAAKGKKELFCELIEAVAAAQREVCAERVPTSWLDPLLSSPEAEALAKKSSTLFVEHLLRAVRDRIRKGGS